MTANDITSFFNLHTLESSPDNIHHNHSCNIYKNKTLNLADGFAQQYLLLRVVFQELEIKKFVLFDSIF